MKRPQKILNFLGSRNGMRLGAIVAAVAVWYVLQAATSNPMIVTDIPITIQPPPDWRVVETSARAIDVAFLGTRDDLRYLNRELIKVTVDARAHTNNSTFVVSLGAANINAPGNARIDFIRPATLILRLDREITKNLPVKLDTQNLLPDGYEIEKIVITPASVEASGPAQQLAELESIFTTPLDLDGRNRSISKRRMGLVRSGHMSEVQINPATVTLDLTIVERSISTAFPDLPIHALMPVGRSVRADVEPDTVRLTVKGRPELMKNMTAEDLQAYVDATDLDASEPAKLPIRAILPPGLSVVRTEPANATVRLKD